MAEAFVHPQREVPIRDDDGEVDKMNADTLCASFFALMFLLFQFVTHEKETLKTRLGIVAGWAILLAVAIAAIALIQKG